MSDVEKENKREIEGKERRRQDIISCSDWRDDALSPFLVSCYVTSHTVLSRQVTRYCLDKSHGIVSTSHKERANVAER